ncbi:MAG: hypothetical protein LC659_16045, partial [Myxococcales bacterium]|nr:hypothetical protein [Myxococcales bacterium]
VRAGSRVDLSLTGWAIYRAFDVAAATVGARRDVQVYADLSAAIDLSRHIGLVVGGSVARNLSTVADYDYVKVTAHVGVAFGYAGP